MEIKVFGCCAEGKLVDFRNFLQYHRFVKKFVRVQDFNEVFNTLCNFCITFECDTETEYIAFYQGITRSFGIEHIYAYKIMEE